MHWAGRWLRGLSFEDREWPARQLLLLQRREVRGADRHVAEPIHPPVVGVPLQNDFLVHYVACDPVRSVGNDLLRRDIGKPELVDRVRPRLVDLALQFVLGVYVRVRKVHVERPKRRWQNRLHGLVIDLDPFYFFLLAIARVEDREPVDRVALCNLVHDEALEREDHIVSRERHAIGPFHIPEMEGDFLAQARICLVALIADVGRFASETIPMLSQTRRKGYSLQTPWRRGGQNGHGHPRAEPCQSA